MNKPIDYPVGNKHQAKNNLDIVTRDITYAALNARIAANQPVTDEMIRIAREKLDSAHSINSESNRASNKPKLAALTKRFR